MVTSPEGGFERLVSAADGLAEFRRWSGLGAAHDALKDNPLPAVIVVQPRLADPRAISYPRRPMTLAVKRASKL